MIKFLIFSCCFAIAYGINIENVEEGPCIIPKVDQNFDLLWMGEYVQWYFPIRSKYELYQWTVALSGGNVKNVTEDMAERSCMILYVGGDRGASQIAFRGAKKMSFDSRIAGHGVFEWAERKSDGKYGFHGRSYITLTDNKKYFVSVSCWETEKKRSYSVHSNVKTLDEESKSTIRKHLKSLGFNKTVNLVETNYENCYDYPLPQLIRKKHQTDEKSSPNNNGSGSAGNNQNTNGNPNSPSNLNNNPNSNPNNNPNNFNNNNNRFGNNNPNNFNNNNNRFGNNNPNNFNNPNPNNFNNNPNNYNNPNNFGNNNRNNYNNPNNLGNNPNNFGNNPNNYNNPNNFGNNPNRNPYDLGNNNFGNNQNYGQQNRNPSPTNWFSNLISTKINFFSNLFRNLFGVIVRLVTSFIGGGGNGGIFGSLFGGGNNNNNNNNGFGR